MNAEAIAWAAGLFEGEGSISAAPSKGHIRARLGTTDLDVLQRFRDVVGFGVIATEPATKNRIKPLWSWEVSRFEFVQALVAMFWAHLCARRRTQCVDALTFVRSQQRTRRPRHSKRFAVIGG